MSLKFPYEFKIMLSIPNADFYSSTKHPFMKKNHLSPPGVTISRSNVHERKQIP
jgi:hypothetical protein